MKLRLLALLVGAALLGQAQASDAAKPDAGKSAQARAEMDRLVQRIEELAEQLGDEEDVRVIIRRALDGPGAHGGRFEWRSHGQSPEALAEAMSRVGIGVVLAPNPAAKGVRIAGVTPNGPAAKAGLRSGDVLLRINGQAIAGTDREAVEAAREAIGKFKIGDSVRLTTVREGKTLESTAKVDRIARVMLFDGGEGDGIGLAPRPRLHARPGERREVHVVAPRVRMELDRLPDCSDGDEDCRLPVLHEAFRWSGLNLSSMEPGLGRYFGTDKGVLVLSSSEPLKGLQAGDVIQRVDGATVESPREVMRALRDKPVGSQIRFDVLRDRKAATVGITVPKGRPLPFMAPPAPPAPPVPPVPPAPPSHAPGAAPPTPPAPPAAPAPPPPPKGRVAVLSADGEEMDLAEGTSVLVGDDGQQRIVEVIRVTK